jgi:insertion element IS1 protein InsB
MAVAFATLHVSCTLAQHPSLKKSKKEHQLQHINYTIIQHIDPGESVVEIQQVDEAEVDEMWSFVGGKSQQWWLWHAIDHRTGVVLAYVLRTHQDDVFLQLKALLAPLGVRHFDTDSADVYGRHLEPEQHAAGKIQTQKIERKHLTFRSRLK